MKDQPTKRHPALQPLSRHHHHALVLAQLLIRQQEEPSVLKEKVSTFWTNGGRAHFLEEEEFLLPEFAKNTSIVRQEIGELLLEHVKVRSLISEICTENKDGKMEELGELLRSHIHKEERIVFPMIESVLTEEQLASLSTHFFEHEGAHVVDLAFKLPRNQ